MKGLETNALWVEAERIAREFHAAYERLAPSHGYETREESRTEWDALPAANRGLMVDTVRDLLEAGVLSADRSTLPEPDDGASGNEELATERSDKAAPSPTQEEKDRLVEIADAMARENPTFWLRDGGFLRFLANRKETS